MVCSQDTIYGIYFQIYISDKTVKLSNSKKIVYI
jgi:hypothetical protein